MAMEISGGVMKGVKKIIFGATAALIGTLFGSTTTYLWSFQDIHHNFPAKDTVVRKIKLELIKRYAGFMHATSNKLKIIPIYLPDRNCVLVRSERAIAFNSDEIFYWFDKNWRGLPHRVIGVTLQMGSEAPEDAEQ